jgi:hypothetical protein
MTYKNWLIPKRMRTLPRDKRGYPIPFIVMINKGVPLFTVNDFNLVHDCITKALCSVCGKRLTDDLWFVGGSRAFLSSSGAFLDPPMHQECAEYSLRVCPFLAAPNWTRSLGSKIAAALPEGLKLKKAEFVGPLQPELFGLGMTYHYHTLWENNAPKFVIRYWLFLEWWKNGEVVPAPISREPLPY